MSLGSAQLTTRALARLQYSFRPSTKNAYFRMWKDFQAFLVVAELTLSQVNHFVLLAFMQYLSENSFTPSNISNYMAGVRAYFVINSLDTQAFRHEQIAMFHKSLKLNRSLAPRKSTLIDINLLEQLVVVANSLPNPHIYIALFTLCFFSFL